eukprot:CAMPEP_0204821884 /NCGR_PEP_ID=MMETSP1346-20131115/88_1 /ASSEMBLY_ACC=CAM_ASM_000771 /TAXON_ID=215587 /ORGANISM="Aplanochytrium stocchinoi, Strain GSBS06" /LENGTH=535 /DNA_ID=CAMNT_0051947843 /DNA_START=1002 /DNA_END=2609 /DNA_ORIENTATION=+
MNQGKGNFQHMMIRRIKNCLRRVCRDDHRVFEGVVERLHDELDKLSISVDPKTVSLKCSLHHCCVGVEAKFLEEDGISCSNGHFLCSDDFSRYCKEKLQLESRDEFELNEFEIYCPLRETGECRQSRAFGVKEIADHTTRDIFKTLMKIRVSLLTTDEKVEHNLLQKECLISAECDTDTLHKEDGIECSTGHFICAKDFTRLVESQIEVETLGKFEERGGMMRCPFFDDGCKSEPFTDDEIKLTSVDAFVALMKGRMRLKVSVYEREIEDLRHKLRDCENMEAMELPERRERDIQNACHYITENILNLHCPGCKHVYAEVEEGDCMAVTCSTCNTHFCGYCQEMCKSSLQAHKHAMQCPEGPGSYFPGDQLESIHRYLRTQRIQRYLDDGFVDDDIYDRIIESLQPQLIGLGIDIKPRNLSNSEIIEDCDVDAAKIAFDEAGGGFEERSFELLPQEVDIDFEDQKRYEARVGMRVAMNIDDSEADWTNCPGFKLCFSPGYSTNDFIVREIRNGFFTTEHYTFLWAPLTAAVPYEV